MKAVCLIRSQCFSLYFSLSCLSLGVASNFPLTTLSASPPVLDTLFNHCHRKEWLFHTNSTRSFCHRSGNKCYGQMFLWTLLFCEFLIFALTLIFSVPQEDRLPSAHRLSSNCSLLHFWTPATSSPAPPRTPPPLDHLFPWMFSLVFSIHCLKLIQSVGLCFHLSLYNSA